MERQLPVPAAQPGKVISPLDSNLSEPKAGPPILPFSTYSMRVGSLLTKMPSA